MRVSKTATLLIQLLYEYSMSKEYFKEEASTFLRYLHLGSNG